MAYRFMFVSYIIGRTKACKLNFSVAKFHSGQQPRTHDGDRENVIHGIGE